MAFDYFAPTESRVLGEKTSLTAAVAASGTDLTVENTAGFFASQVSVSGITRVSTTATVTTSSAHGFSTGDYITVSGADQSDYNITAEITVTTTTAFTYEVENSPTTPATGTILATREEFVLVGDLGSEDSEVVTSSDVPDATSITVGAVNFAHGISSTVWQLQFDKRRLWGATSSGGTFSVIETQSLSVDEQLGNHFVYNGSTNTHFKVDYYNSKTGRSFPDDIDDARELAGDEKQFYTTISKYKTWAGVSGDDRDDEIQLMIEVMTDTINSYLFNDTTATLFSKSYTENTSVGTTKNHDILIMKHSPITSVTSIDYDGSNWYTNGGTNLIDIDTLRGKMIYINSSIPRGGVAVRLPIQVVYTAGYSTVPGDVELGMLKLMHTSLDTSLRDSDGIKAYSIGTKRVEYQDAGSATAVNSSAISPAIKSLLAPYKSTNIYTWR